MREYTCNSGGQQEFRGKRSGFDEREGSLPANLFGYPEEIAFWFAEEIEVGKYHSVGLEGCVFPRSFWKTLGDFDSDFLFSFLHSCFNTRAVQSSQVPDSVP